METALISDYRTQPTDRFMWAQEGRRSAVIRAVKSPVRRNWVCGSVLNVPEVSPSEGPETPPGDDYCRLNAHINSVLQQQLAGRKERE